MIALLLIAAVSSVDLQQWMNAQAPVRAYEEQRQLARPPGEDAFRQPPVLSREMACRGSRQAMAAAVFLFKTVDESKVMLIDPALRADNGGEAILQLNDQGKTVLQDRARRYEQDAGRYEPACLG